LAIATLPLGIACLNTLVDRLVDLRIDAADEEAGDARDRADRLALLHPRLKPSDIRFGHLLISMQ
jgi:hypothetical protein